MEAKITSYAHRILIEVDLGDAPATTDDLPAVGAAQVRADDGRTIASWEYDNPYVDTATGQPVDLIDEQAARAAGVPQTGADPQWTPPEDDPTAQPPMRFLTQEEWMKARLDDVRADLGTLRERGPLSEETVAL